MAPGKNRLSGVEFTSGHTTPTKLIAALSILTMANGMVVAYDRERIPHQKPVCIEQACGQIALSVLDPPHTIFPPNAPEAIRPTHKSATQAKPKDVTHPVSKPQTSKPSLPVPTDVFASFTHDITFADKRGVDISWPQCTYDKVKKKYTSELSERVVLPKDADFVIVGTTHGHVSDRNPCLVEELQAAQNIAGSNVSMYAIMGNPKNSPIEAEAYGRYIARKNLKVIKEAAAQLKRLLQPLVWLDVERGTWQPDTGAGHSSNRAFLRGIIKTMEAAGVQVGIYTAKDVEARPISLNMWAPIMGNVPSTSVLNVPEWISSPGAEGCEEQPFIQEGSVVLGQHTLEYPEGTKEYLDFDGGCTQMPKAKPAFEKRK